MKMRRLIQTYSQLFFALSLVLTKKAEAAAADPSQKELSQTPTWAVASVCTVIIVISLLLEHSLHKLGHWLHHKHKKALFEALEKVKAELMILGFISLALTFSQNYVSKICVRQSLADSMLPCSDNYDNKDTARKLAAAEPTKCAAGKEPLISVNGLHQLHILIFFLAVFHVVYSAITMALGRLKIKLWKEWENEAASREPTSLRLTHETSFVRAHSALWAKIPFIFYIGCFFRQFFRSVRKTDYMTLRNGFITLHLAPGSQFNFQKYVKRALQDDFKIVVGVSPVLWASFVIFLLLNIKGSHAMLVASIIPPVIILVVGTKLMAILTNMALEITDRNTVVRGIPLVQASDRHFWFEWPELLLHLIHFALFQNAFQITYYAWIWYSFGWKSCFVKNVYITIGKLTVGVLTLFVCSYITLPLYSLVSQMGASIKKAVFDEQTTTALKRWHMGAKKKLGGKSPDRTLGRRTTFSSPTPGSTTLHRYNSTSNREEDPQDFDEDVDVMEVEQPATIHIEIDRNERSQ